MNNMFLFHEKGGTIPAEEDMKSNKTTLDDVAVQAGTSRATASMILSKKMLGRFSIATIKKVQSAADQLGYRKPCGSVRNILIICPSVFNPYFSSLLQGMDMEAIENGYRTIVYNTYWDLERERAILDLVRQQQIDGIIFAMIPQQGGLAAELSDLLPVVAVGDFHQELQMDTVEINNSDAGRLVAQHLSDLGHANIAYISTSLNEFHSARTRRLEGVRSVWGERPLSIFSEDIEPATEINNINIEFETGYKLAQQCIAQSPQVTAMVAINDMVAYGVMNAITDMGFSIPGDYSVCGFDNIFPSKFNGVSLTTVDHQIVQQGKRAIMLLRQRFDMEHEEPSREVTRVEYRCSLVRRGSTAAPRIL